MLQRVCVWWTRFAHGSQWWGVAAQVGGSFIALSLPSPLFLCIHTCADPMEATKSLSPVDRQESFVRTNQSPLVATAGCAQNVHVYTPARVSPLCDKKKVDTSAGFCCHDLQCMQHAAVQRTLSFLSNYLPPFTPCHCRCQPPLDIGRATVRGGVAVGGLIGGGGMPLPHVVAPQKSALQVFGYFSICALRLDGAGVRDGMGKMTALRSLHPKQLHLQEQFHGVKI